MENVSNKIVLSGFAGGDAEVKELAGNRKLVKINLAVNEFYKNALGEEVKNTQWFTLTFWNNQAEAASFVKKGNQISIEGRLQNNSYEAKDGTKRYTTNIVVNQLEINPLEKSN